MPINDEIVDRVALLCRDERWRWVSLERLSTEMKSSRAEIRAALLAAGWRESSARASALPEWWPGNGRQSARMLRGFEAPARSVDDSERRLVAAALSVFEDREIGTASVAGLVKDMLRLYPLQLNDLGDRAETRRVRLRRALARALARRGVRSVHLPRKTADPSKPGESVTRYVRCYRREDLERALNESTIDGKTEEARG